MAARVGTALSDENVLKHCADYRPIPMHLTNAIVDGNMKPQTSTPFSSKPLKYHKKVARPEHFDAFAKSLARNLGNDPEFRGRLQSAYAAVINAAPPDPAGPDPAPINEAIPAAPPGLPEEILRLVQEMQAPEVQPVQEQYHNPIQQEFSENVNLDAIPEEAEASDGDSVPELEPNFVDEVGNVDPNDPRPFGEPSESSEEDVPELEPDFVDEVGNVDPNDPRPFGEPSESSEEEGPSPSTAPPPRRSSRTGASRPEGFFSNANQAARGEGAVSTPGGGISTPASGAGTTAPNDPSHSNFFFQR